MKIRILASILMALISLPALGYIGPGMGGGAILSVIGFFVAFALAIFGILYYPIKRAIKRRKRRKAKAG